MHKTMGSAAFTINAASASAGAITYTSGTPATATISGNTVTLVAAGTTIITATQAADGIYNAATTTAILTVGTTGNSNPTLVWVPAIKKTMGNAPFSITTGLSTNSGAAATYYSNNTGVSTLSTSTATLVAPGISVLTAMYPANGSYNAGSISTILTVGAAAKTDPVISGFPAINKFVNDIPFTLTPPTSNSTGGFFYLSSNPAIAVVDGNTVTITGSGICNIIAVQYADGIYNSATISATLTVTQIFSYPTPNVFVRSTAITNLVPALISAGTVNAYTVSPALSRGLTISSTTGIISGTPIMVTPNATYTVTAVNTGGSATTNLDIRVDNIAPTALSYTTPNVYTVGTGIGILTPTVTGGEATDYSISPALPAGLVINDITGEITGTPTSASPINTYVVTATNSGGSKSANVVITVNDIAPLLITYTTPNVLSKGNVITPITASASGGAIVSYSIAPSLPAGLTLNTTTGSITGIPTVVSGLTTYVVTATNTGGSETANLEILVNDAAPSNLSYTSPNVYVKTVPITSLLPTSTGGVATSYQVSPALPAGLTLNTTTGDITGTPTSIAPTATYTVTASNFVGSASFDIIITVNDAPPATVSYPTPITLWQGCSVNINPTVTGGIATTYSVSPLLPAGLILNTSTGVISGSPVNLMTQTGFVITAANVSGSTTTGIQINIMSPTWTGVNNTSWNDAGNWSSNAIPSSLTNILFSATASNDLILDHDRSVSSLDFNGSNKKIIIGNNFLTANTIIGAGANSYVQTNGTGTLKMTIASAASVQFPVGNSAYNPVTITNNTSATDDFTTSVLDEVYANGISGAKWAHPRVMRTWNIFKTNANGGGGIDLLFNWNTGETFPMIAKNLFHYENGDWAKQTGTTVVTANSLAYTGYTGSFSPFAIADNAEVLPVKWLDFTATLKDRNIELKWSTTNEIQNKNFIVLHSTDALHWNQAGEVQAAQNSSAILYYSFIDLHAVTGNNYYRLLQNDIGGNTSYSKIISVYLKPETGLVSVYPNPVTDDVLYVKLLKAATVELYNNVGVLVLRKALPAGANRLDLKSFSKGLFMLKINEEMIKVVVP